MDIYLKNKSRAPNRETGVVMNANVVETFACCRRRLPMAQDSITPNVYALNSAFGVTNPESQRDDNLSLPLMMEVLLRVAGSQITASADEINTVESRTT